MIHRTIHERLLSAEVVLILASVLIFRSAWHLLDKFYFFNNPIVLIITLLFGFWIAVPTWRYVMEQEDKHKH